MSPRPTSNPEDPLVSGTRAARVPGSGWDELVRGCAEGDQGALSALYDQSSSLVYGIALRLLSNPADAEEVTIDVYNQVWRTAGHFEASRGTVTAWLVMLTRSRAIDRIRASAKRVRMESPMIETTEIPASQVSPEEATEAGQRHVRIRAAMAGLPPEQRVTIELAFFSGLSHSELADHLGLPLGTVKTRIRSSMIKLRESLGEYA